MTQDPTPIAQSQEFGRQLSFWLQEWAEGRSNDQHATFLNKVIQARIDAAVAHGKAKSAAPKRSDNEIIRGWIERYAADQVSPETNEYRRMEEVIARRIADARAEQEEFEAVAAANGAGVSGMEDELLESMKAQEEQIQKLLGELARAHDWRFNLETHARQAHAAVHEFLRSTKAPSREAMTAVLTTLRAGIEWTP